MSELKALDELRNLARGGSIASNIAKGIRSIADEIEAELSERYIKLPVDADGVPIRVGDMMEDDGEPFTVCAVAPGCVHRWHVCNIGEPSKGTVSYPPSSLRHFKPRTVEDVLREFADRYLDYEGVPSAGRRGVGEALMGEYADELRELMGGEE